jgi:hypothetical protein
MRLSSHVNLKFVLVVKMPFCPLKKKMLFCQPCHVCFSYNLAEESSSPVTIVLVEYKS